MNMCILYAYNFAGIKLENNSELKSLNFSTHKLLFYY